MPDGIRFWLRSITPGSDAAGVIEPVGPGVTRVTPADRVYTSGTLTGKPTRNSPCACERRFTVFQITFLRARRRRNSHATAYRALFFRAKAQPAEIVFVHGASGGVGIAATQIARAQGMRVIGTGGTRKGRALVRDQEHTKFWTTARLIIWKS